MLHKILDYKRQELEHVRRRVNLRDVRLKAADAAPAVPFFRDFSPGINIIAEAKKASPSKGMLREDFRPVDLALEYAENGAKAVSVLTDEKFFQGSPDFLRAIAERFCREGAKLKPLLRKDFTLDEYHVHEARGLGADAVLLIVAALDAYQLKDYRQTAEALGMTALVEVHDEKELAAALASGATAIGVNNRDLKTFATDVGVTRGIAKFLAPSRAAKNDLKLISESGLKDVQTLRDLKNLGVDGFLIGETLVREKDAGAKLRELME